MTLPVNPLSHSATPVVTFFEGGSALSEFRARQLLPRLQAVDPRIDSLSARFVHLVVTETALDAAGQERFAALLGYGEPFVAPARSGPTIVVTPRLGTVSPWASKATDIAHNCGLALRRVERVIEYRLTLKAPLLDKALGKVATLEGDKLAAAGDLLHDRMTESVLAQLDQAANLFAELPAQPMAQVDVQGGGRAALVEANKNF